MSDEAGGLLQGCETLGPSGSLLWAGEGVLAALTAQLAWEKVWTPWQSNSPPQTFPLPVGTSPLPLENTSQCPANSQGCITSLLQGRIKDSITPQFPQL